jgi:hypothetical protein
LRIAKSPAAARRTGSYLGAWIAPNACETRQALEAIARWRRFIRC